jgi:hypothetical protein
MVARQVPRLVGLRVRRAREVPRLLGRDRMLRGRLSGEVPRLVGRGPMLRGRLAGELPRGQMLRVRLSGEVPGGQMLRVRLAGEVPGGQMLRVRLSGEVPGQVGRGQMVRVRLARAVPMRRLRVAGQLWVAADAPRLVSEARVVHHEALRGAACGKPCHGATRQERSQKPSLGQKKGIRVAEHVRLWFFAGLWMEWPSLSRARASLRRSG